MAICDNKNGAETMGKDYLLFVDVNPTVGQSTWILVGGQRGSSFSMKRDEIDTSDKTTGGWGSKRAGMGSWSVELDGMAVLGDEGAQYLEDKFLEGEIVSVMLRHESGKAYKGCAAITEYSLETPHDDVASLKGTLNGIGKPIITENEPDPLAPETP